MARQSPPFSRIRQAASARKSKRWWSPMTRRDADDLSIRYHASLAALRNRQGTHEHLRTLLVMIVLTGFIGDAYVSPIRPEVLIAAEQAIIAAIDHGQDRSEWVLDANAVELCAAILTHHDHQLRTAPIAAINSAKERLDRLIADQSYHSVQPIWQQRK